MLQDQEVETRLRQMLAKYTESLNSPIPEDGDIREYGVDSVDLIELFADIEHTFGFRWGDEDLDIDSLHTLRAITKRVSSKLQ